MFSNDNNKLNTPPFAVYIKINDYDDLFHELHYSKLNTRKINSSLDELLQALIFHLDNNINMTYLNIIMPKENYSIEKEELSKEGIINNYKAFSIYEKKIRFIGLRRIIYYVIISFLLFNFWAFVTKHWGDSILSAFLNSGATVVLWQATTLIFIENKNLKATSLLHKKLSNLKITFSYE